VSEQIDRMASMLAGNEKALQKAVAADFKTALQEHVRQIRLRHAHSRKIHADRAV
jgi:hypothetical protein